MTDERRATAEDFFGIGDHFFIAAKALAQHPEKRIDYNTVVAQIACDAFATEAYLKSLSLIETGKFKPTHDLKDLFGRISQDSRKIITRRWNKEHVPSISGSATGAPAGYTPPKTLLQALDQSKDTFINWRYSNKKLMVWTVMNLPWLIRERIFELRPAWQENSPTPWGTFHPNPTLGSTEHELG